MTDGAAPEAIRTGPRWEAVAAAVAAAEEALEPPLTDQELDEGWTEEGRGEVLADVQRVRDELTARPDTAAVLAEWEGVDALDVEGDALRAEAILDVDVVLGELERAERALLEGAVLRDSLEGAISAEDREDGFDEAARDALVELVDEVRAVLRAGESLTPELMDRWADALRADGFRRATLRPGVDDDADLAGFTGQRVEQFPPGRRWEPVAIFDGWLFNIGWTDTLTVALDDEGAAEPADATEP